MWCVVVDNDERHVDDDGDNGNDDENDKMVMMMTTTDNVDDDDDETTVFLSKEIYKHERSMNCKKEYTRLMYYLTLTVLALCIYRRYIRRFGQDSSSQLRTWSTAPKDR